MPFESIPFISKPMKDVLASISYRKLETKHGRNKNPKLIIGIPRALAGDFKPKPTQLFDLLLGNGADAGKARIQPGTVGVKPTLLKGGIVFRFGYLPYLGSDTADKDFVAVKSIANGFEIALPPWFKNDGA